MFSRERDDTFTGLGHRICGSFLLNLLPEFTNKVNKIVESIVSLLSLSQAQVMTNTNESS